MMLLSGNLSREVRLNDIAARGIARAVVAPADDEQPMHAAVGLTIRQSLEARLADRAVQRDERRHGIARPERRGGRELRIDGRRGATDSGLQVATATAVEVEPGSQSVADALGLREIFEAGLEENFLVVRSGPAEELRLWEAPPCTPGSVCARAEDENKNADNRMLWAASGPSFFRLVTGRLPV